MRLFSSLAVLIANHGTHCSEKLNSLSIEDSEFDPNTNTKFKKLDLSHQQSIDGHQGLQELMHH